MRRIVIATSNGGKLAEFRRYLAVVPQFDVCSLADLGVELSVDETGTTFFENAWLKASASAQLTGEWSLADDSGLEVDALGGRPGVYSARFSGLGATDAQNSTKLLEELVAAGPAERSARFRCALVVAEAGRSEPLCVAEGICEGTIAERPRGSLGFGYDPVFIPNTYNATFGELGPEVKDRLSHRAAAAAQLIPKLKALRQT